MTKPKSKVITVHVTGPLAPYAQQFRSLEVDDFAGHGCSWVATSALARLRSVNQMPISDSS